MADTIGSSGSGHPNLNLTPEEKRVYAQLLKEADPEGFGAVSGDVAVKFFERTKLPADVLGQIWQIADTENRGFLTPAGFGVVLRLIGHAQAGRPPSAQLATQTAPLPRFDPIHAEQTPQPIPQQSTGPPASPTPAGTLPIRVPALSPDKIAEYSAMFDKSGAENGLLSGLVAKQIFEKARLPNEVLGRIWALADTQNRGALDVTEFVIAMHLLASYKSGQMRGVPSTLPPGLYEAAARRPPPRVAGGSRPGSSAMTQQFTGFNARPQSPITRQQVATPLSAQSTGEAWSISPAEKARFDTVFASVDRQGRGFIDGDQAVEFFSNARLPEETLAQIWDLADIDSDGKLTRDEFAVAMYLIRQQRGTKDGRGNLPPALPASLVPPSMRKQSIAPSQPTAPSFEAAPAATKSRSAADDLFGLDAFEAAPSAPVPTQSSLPAPSQAPQSTGGTDARFAHTPAFTAPISPQATSSTFKPFVPSSSFGQSILPQSTGSPAPVQAKSLPPPHDDLLGDADPEISSKLTHETSELGNLSNQVSTLSKQMTELQGTRKQTEQELSHTTAQKQAFESRLAQLRSLYEKEAQEVKALQEQLTAVKNETKRIQQEMAMLDGTHQDLSTQHQQLRAGLESDQRENAALKERIRQTNQEIEQLKPQLEKLKSEARQQKGLVAINKKQLATNEAERDRLKAEIAAAQKQLEDAHREAEESARQVEESQKQLELEQARNVPIPAVKSPPVASPPVASPPVASPAPSTSSNPFFRRPAEAASSPPASSGDNTKDNQSAFDSIFGPSFTTSSASAPAPPVSFSGAESPAAASATTSQTEAPSSTSAPPDMVDPPAPGQAGQITSAALPFRKPLDRQDSISSSVKVALPASRLSPADTPRALTPTTDASSATGQKDSAEDPFTAAGPDEEQESIRRTLPQPDTSGKTPAEEPGPDDIPGAFPTDPQAQTPAATTANGEVGLGSTTQPKPSEQNFDDFFGGPAHQRTASQKAAEFDSAFAGISQTPPTNGPERTTNKEFPDIQELDPGDDDDDSSDYSQDTPLKFEDDFNATSSPRGGPTETDTAAEKKPEVQPPNHDSLAPRPALTGPTSTTSSLPPADRQASPPTYGDSVPQDNPTHFPREYEGLLPEREDPTVTHPTAGGSTNPAPPPPGSPPSYGPEVHERDPSETKVATAPPPTKAAPFDFDSAFEGVGAAPVEEDDDDDNDADVFNPAQNSTDFDPTFDSPAQSQTSTAPPHQSTYESVTRTPAGGDDFFKSNPPAATSTGGGAQPAAPSPVSHDWDALFAPLSSNTPAAAEFPNVQGGDSTASASAKASGFAASTTTSPSAPPNASNMAPNKSGRPQPGRALSMGTEHDDPILKRLTAMGWSREESLAALEKFDYNIDKAADYLTFRS
ncbi:putative calcium-binding protein [Exophiala dermatitidis]